MSTIRRKLTKGVIWNAVAQFGGQGLNAVVTLVLAALLSPSAFGLVGMVTVFTAFFSYLTEFGLTPAFIRLKSIDKTDEGTVFWSTAVFSIVAFVAVFAAAPLIASFYGEPELIPIVRVLFATFLLSPMVFVPESVLKRSLEYPRLARIELISMVLGGGVAIVLALLGFGVWSLVAQQIARTFFKGVALALDTRWVPPLKFSFSKLRSLLAEGVYFTAHNLVQFANDNIDYLIVGRVLGAHWLGIYTLAFRLSKYPFQKMWQVFGQMLFPAFSKIRHDRARLTSAFRKTGAVASSILVPLLTLIFFGIPSFTQIFLGTDWDRVVPIVQMMVPYLVVFGFALPDTSYLSAIGRIRLIVITKLSYALALLIIGYFATVAYGAIGMAASYSAVSILFALVQKGFVLRETRQRAREVFSGVAIVPAVISVVGGITVSVLTQSGVLQLVLLSVVILGPVFVALVRSGVVDLQNRRVDFDRLIANPAKNEQIGET